jgi:ABC-type transporter Mla subunit MlaD
VPRLPGPGAVVGLARRGAAALPRTPGVREAGRALVELPGALLDLPVALLELPGAIADLPGALRRGERAIRRLDELTARVEGLVGELEEPVRGLVPGLTRVGTVLDDPVVDRLPRTVSRLEAEIVPVVATLRETQARVAAIAASTERITTFVDDAGARIGSLPGLLLRRPFRAADPVRDYPQPAEYPEPGPAERGLPAAGGSIDGDDDRPDAQHP